MAKLILVDGNNLLFRSYYATAYSGKMMKNSKGFPTNALFGFVSMINKILDEENPSYMAVAFDVGKNFRKEKYDFYKDGRSETPEELKMQMPVAREILDGMGIKHFELEPYEADDIIGTIVKLTEEDPDFASTIVSSDKDLLQLISNETEVKLLKQTGFIRYDKETFIKDYGIEPIRIIDLKALMGDASDNIPGVKGIGEKTALKLLQEFGSLENLYDNIEQVKGKNREKLEVDKDSAFMSKEIATIYKEVPLNIKLTDLKRGKVGNKLIKVFQELEFYSFLKNIEKEMADDRGVDVQEEKVEVKVVDDITSLELDDEIAIYLELDNHNYHIANILGMAIKDSHGTYFVPEELVIDCLEKIKNKKIVTFDAKKIIVNTKVKINCVFDLAIAAYLCNYNLKEDVGYLMNQLGSNLPFYENFLKDKEREEKLINYLVSKISFIYDNKAKFQKELVENNCLDLYEKIEHPLLYVLSDMEIAGIKVEAATLDKMKEEIGIKIELVSEEIYQLAGEKFNIGSPKQLGEILFEKLELAAGKKNKIGYKTDVNVLEKLVDKHPIVEKILSYRNLTKLYSTYIEGLENYILADKKIHTIYKQTLTRTGRLSSTDPNLQNIPIKEELGRKIRQAFVPVYDVFLSADYSQIELRILAHISDCKPLIESFKNGEDIHSKVASDIYGVDIDAVTKQMRRTAKAVIFGIVYGISGFGLGENLDISKKDADAFIKKYYELYPEVKRYMDGIIEKAHEDGYVTTLFNRKRIIDEINNKNYMIRNMGERMALNTPIQGTSADIMKMAMINVHKEMKKANLKSKMLLQVHDEIIIDCCNEELEQVKEIVGREMENAFILNVPLKVEMDTGINWYETK